MLAIILAAGRGRRLGRLGQDIPKCLIEVEGRTLLARHLDIFRRTGIREVLLVTGYRTDDVQAELAALGANDLSIDVVFNPEYRHGSIVSLHTGLQSVETPRDCIIMDADVLYPTELYRRLLAAEHPNSVLLDATATASGEEMMLGARDGFIRRIRKNLDIENWDPVGETVGFLRVSEADFAALKAATAEVVAEGLVDDEYEVAYERFILSHEVGFERVDDLPWTEIDFPEDVTRAVEEVLPRVKRCEAETAAA